MSRSSRTIAAGLLGLGGVLLTAGPATAHVTIEEATVPAGGFTAVTLTVPHGCDGSPTTSVAIEIPEDVLGVTPEVHPDWTVEVETEALDEPVEGSHGQQITERDAVVIYTAATGSGLPDGFRTSFVLGFQAPEAPDETLYFKTVQSCAEGETAWVSEDPDSEEPAPSVLVEEATEGAHGNDDAEGEEEPTEVVTEPVADTSDDSDSSNAVAIAGLVAGLLGVGLGAVALSRSRQTS